MATAVAAAVAAAMAAVAAAMAAVRTPLRARPLTVNCVAVAVPAKFAFTTSSRFFARAIVDGPARLGSLNSFCTSPRVRWWRSLTTSTAPLAFLAVVPRTTSRRPRSSSRPSPPVTGPPSTVISSTFGAGSAAGAGVGACAACALLSSPWSWLSSLALSGNVTRNSLPVFDWTRISSSSPLTTMPLRLNAAGSLVIEADRSIGTTAPPPAFTAAAGTM